MTRTAMNLSDRWNRLRNRWLLLALAAPLVVFPWSFDATELPKLTFLRLAAVGLVLTGLFTVSRSAWASSNESEVSEIHPLRLPVLLYLILMGFSAFMSPDRWSSFAALADLALLAFFTFTVTGASKDAGFQRDAWKMMAGVGGISAGWTLLQTAGFDSINAAALRHAGGIPVGPFSDPVTLAGFLAAAFTVAMGLCLIGKKPVGEGFCLLLIALALGMTRQPLPIFGGLVGAALTLALLRKAEGSASLRRWALPLAAVTLLAAGFGASRPAASDGAALRDLHATALVMVRAKPLFGWGPGSFGLVAPRYAASDAFVAHEPNRSPAPNPRSLPLWVLTSGGALSLLAFAGVLAGAGFQLYKRLRPGTGGTEADGFVNAAEDERSTSSQTVNVSDAGLAAVWAGFLTAWLIQGWASTPSIALQLPFWCVLALASTSTLPAKKAVEYGRWPVSLRILGAGAAVFLLLPLPRPAYLKQRGRTATSLGSELMPGPGAAVRWLIGDVYYRSAVLARERKDWDGALFAHLNALMWAPSRMENWIGHGETAYAAMRQTKGKPLYWLQYGTMGYYRAQKMQPLNGFLYYGEARLLAEAVGRGGRRHYPDAKDRFERAIALYPNVARFHAEYARMLDRMGEREQARRQKDLALRLRPDRAGRERTERERVSRLAPSDERLPALRSDISGANVESSTRRGDRSVH